MAVDVKTLPYVNPALSIDVSATKGRLVVARSLICEGDVLLIDAPNALVPAMLRDEPPYLICSRHGCYRRIPATSSITATQKYSCPSRCIEEVVWCSLDCRAEDAVRHDLECLWLKRTSQEIRETHGDSDFGLIWLIAKILIVRHLEELNGPTLQHQEQASTSVGTPTEDLAVATNTSNSKERDSHFRRRGWEAVRNLVGDPLFFKPEKVQHWELLTRKYLCKGGLQSRYNEEEIVSLICKVETNSFGLYPGVTGKYPAVLSEGGRGDYYGAGVFATAAMFNHACCPNVTHELDEYDHRIFKAGRDIQVGEECCICYFDLVEFPVPSARREAIQTSWDFVCDCQRCEEEFRVPDDFGMIDLDF